MGLALDIALGVWDSRYDHERARHRMSEMLDRWAWAGGAHEVKLLSPCVKCQHFGFQIGFPSSIMTTVDASEW